MAYLYNQQPLAAFVKLKIAQDMVGDTSDDVDWDATSIVDPDNNNSSNNIIIDFSWRKAGSDSGEASFNITAFDETAIYLESIIANSEGEDTGLSVEYGWCAGGSTIPGRSSSVHGKLKEYSISFNGPSTELNIVGMLDAADKLANADDMDYPSDVYHGNPSEIVRTICSQNGWDSSGVVDTVDVMESGSATTPKTYLQGNRSLKEFIENDLCKDAQTADGQGAFEFFVDENNVAYFKPKTNQIPGAIKIDIYDENGNLAGSSYAGGTGGLNLAPAREFNYYTGQDNNEVISFTPNYTFSAGAGLAKGANAVNSETGEVFALDINGSALSLREGQDKVVTMNGSRMLGLSMSSFEELAAKAKILWCGFASIPVTATLEILGDPQFSPLVDDRNTVKVSVYTKYGIKHHTSGTYNITGVEESVSGGVYMTTLELRKVQGDEGASQYVGDQHPENQGNSGGYSTNQSTYGPGQNDSTTRIQSNSEVVNYAMNYLGNPYVYGGNSLTDGIDCSHFVTQVLTNTGHYSGGYRTSGDWATAGEPVTRDNVQPGDIIVYGGHVAIYVDSNHIVHAKGKDYGIVVTECDPFAYHNGATAIRRV